MNSSFAATLLPPLSLALATTGMCCVAFYSCRLPAVLCIQTSPRFALPCPFLFPFLFGHPFGRCFSFWNSFWWSQLRCLSWCIFIANLLTRLLVCLLIAEMLFWREREREHINGKIVAVNVISTLFAIGSQQTQKSFERNFSGVFREFVFKQPENNFFFCFSYFKTKFLEVIGDHFIQECVQCKLYTHSHPSFLGETSEHPKESGYLHSDHFDCHAYFHHHASINRLSFYQHST